MTNNNTNKENEMFDKLTSEDMIADMDNYNDALEMAESQLELEMIEADEYIDEMYDELEDDDADEDDEYDEDMYSEMDALAHADTSYEYDETESHYDNDRDGDFYSS